MKKLALAIYRLLFANRLFYKVNYGMYLLSLKGLGVLNFENNRLSGERKFIELLSRKYPAPMILDVGGNEGDYSALCKELSPGATIHTFEPHPKTYDRLAKRAAELGFHVVNTAVSNVYEEVVLYDYASAEGSSHASLYGSVLTDLHSAELNAIKVKAIPLDDYLRQNHINHVHLLKIDAEGHELKILMGIHEHLAAGKVDIIHFEFNEMNIMSKTFMKDFYDLLSNYAFYRMLPNHLLPLGEYSAAKYEIFLYQNIVAIRRDVKLI